MNSQEKIDLDYKWISSRPVVWTICQCALVFALIHFFKDMQTIGEGNSPDWNTYFLTAGIVAGLKIGEGIRKALKRKKH